MPAGRRCPAPSRRFATPSAERTLYICDVLHGAVLFKRHCSPPYVDGLMDFAQKANTHPIPMQELKQ
jgi:hypothetical protein